MEMNTVDAFDKVELLRLAFKGLEDDELQEMAALTRICTYPPDHILCQEGAFEDLFYVVADGSAVITKKIGDQDGERLLRIVGRGDLVGEMSMIQKAPRSATVRTTSDLTVLQMEKKDFETMLGRSSRMAIDIIRTTLDRMRENDQMTIEDLQKTNKILRQLDRNKLEFIQVAAHELRTPLTVLKGYANLLNSFPDIKTNPTVEDVIQGIIKGANRMHEVVNMMLDVTRIDGDTTKISPAPVAVKLVMNELIDTFKKDAEDRQIEIVVDQKPDVRILNADPTLIQKALYQLLVNAIKYTPDGGRVNLVVQTARMENNQPGVEFRFEDNGIGLDTEHHELVFEKFYQVGDVAFHSSGKTTFKGGGPGLGLAIVRGVARAHGGRVWVESLGYDETRLPGSTFVLQLPIDPPSSGQ
jgi:signal transduction histidine kinase